MRDDERLDTALELSVLYGEHTNVGQLAAAAGLSPSRFSHLFVRRAGMLPGKHLRLMKRLRKEQRLAFDLIRKALQPKVEH